MNGQRFKLSLLSATLCLVLQPVFAEEGQELEGIDVVGSVAKAGKVDYFSPRSVSVINSQQLSDSGAKQLDQVLHYQAGIETQNYGSDLDDSNWVLIRGFEPRITLDGTALYKGGYSGWNPDLYGFEAIEVVKGADSLTYGVAPAGGIINLVTKRPTPEPQGEINVKVGNLNSRGISADISNKFADNVRYRLVADYDRRDGETFGTWLERYYIAPSLTWDISHDTSLTVIASAQKDVGVPTTSFYPYLGTVDVSQGRISNRTNLGDPTTDTMNRKEYSIGYEFKHDFSNDLVFTQNYRYSRDDRYQFSSFYNSIATFPTYNQVPFLVDVVTNSHTLDNRFAKTWHGEGWENSTIAGIDYQYMKADGRYSYNYALSATNNALNPRYMGFSTFTPNIYKVKQIQLGLYAQNQLKVSNLLLTAGVRHDKARGSSDTQPFFKHDDNNYKLNHTSFSGGLMYMADNGLAPYYSYSESFIPVAGSDGEGIAYKPQQSRQHEVGLKYAPAFIDGEFSISYFTLKQNNSFIQTTTLAKQSGTDVSKGIEFSTNAHITDNITVAATYTYINAKTDLSVTQVDNTKVTETFYKPLVPKNSASLKIAYSGDNYTIGAGIRYMGSQEILLYETSGHPYNGKKLPAVTLIDLMAKYHFTNNWVVQANVSNLTNKRYVTGCYSSCYYGEGRRLDVTLSYKW